MFKAIGIDPGLASTGVGIVKGLRLKVHEFSYGVITTSSQTPLPKRLDEIYTGLFPLLEMEKPDIVIIEDVFSLQKNPKAGIILGKVSGVIILCAHKAGAAINEISVRKTKQILTGNGNADKDQLERSVRMHLNDDEPIKPSHASDALALALAGLFRYGSGVK